MMKNNKAEPGPIPDEHRGELERLVLLLANPSGIVRDYRVEIFRSSRTDTDVPVLLCGLPDERSWIPIAVLFDEDPFQELVPPDGSENENTPPDAWPEDPETRYERQIRYLLSAVHSPNRQLGLMRCRYRNAPIEVTALISMWRDDDDYCTYPLAKLIENDDEFVPTGRYRKVSETNITAS